MRVETLVRTAQWGVELVDALRQRSLLSTPRVVAVDSRAEVLRANDSRWFLEDLPPGTYELAIDATGYVPERPQRTFAPGDSPRLDVVEMLPAPGYPFAPTQRRVSGSMHVGAPDGEPAEGAEVRFTVISGVGATGRTATRTVTGGLYTMWLEPGAPPSAGDPVYPTRLRVEGELVRGSTTYTGNVTFDLDPNRIDNGAPRVTLI